MHCRRFTLAPDIQEHASVYGPELDKPVNGDEAFGSELEPDVAC